MTITATFGPAARQQTRMNRLKNRLIKPKGLTEVGAIVAQQSRVDKSVIRVEGQLRFISSHWPVDVILSESYARQLFLAGITSIEIDQETEKADIDEAFYALITQPLANLALYGIELRSSMGDSYGIPFSWLDFTRSIIFPKLNDYFVKDFLEKASNFGRLIGVVAGGIGGFLLHSSIEDAYPLNNFPTTLPGIALGSFAGYWTAEFLSRGIVYGVLLIYNLLRLPLDCFEASKLFSASRPAHPHRMYLTLPRC